MYKFDRSAYNQSGIVKLKPSVVTFGKDIGSYIMK